MKCLDCNAFIDGQCLYAETPSRLDSIDCLLRIIFIGLRNIYARVDDIACAIEGIDDESEPE